MQAGYRRRKLAPERGVQRVGDARVARPKRIDRGLHNLPHFRWEFALHRLQVEPAVVQAASQLAVDVLRGCCVRTDQRNCREVSNGLRGDKREASIRAGKGITMPSILATRPSITLDAFRATVRTKSGSNLAESSSFVIVRAITTPSPAPGRSPEQTGKKTEPTRPSRSSVWLTGTGTVIQNSTRSEGRELLRDWDYQG